MQLSEEQSFHLPSASVIEAPVSLPDWKNPVSLKPYQEPHSKKLLSIAKLHYIIMDRSPLGAGKTHSAAWFFWEGVRLGWFTFCIVICTLSTRANWEKVLTDYGVTNFTILNFESLRSQKGRQPKHGLLKRVDVEGHAAQFIPTLTFTQMNQAGLCLIVDEFQHIKNKTAQRAAVMAMHLALCSSQGNSRSLFLSGSPFDKEAHVINFLQLSGIIADHRLSYYYKEEGRLVLHGAQELVTYCRAVDDAATTKLLEEEPFTPGNVPHVCYRLWTTVLQHSMSSAMEVKGSNVEADVKNGYFNIPQEWAEALSESIAALGRAARYDEKSDRVDIKDGSMGAITTALQQIEVNKVHIFIRKAIEDLTADPNQKVVMFFNYKAPLETVANYLAPYRPLVLQGSVPPKKREEARKLFQQHDNQYRLLIANSAVASEGIDLDDTHGDFPRKMYLSPSYSMRMHQAAGRCARAMTRSIPIVRVVYGKCGKKEMSILNALARKSKVMAETLEEQVSQGVKFPADYPEDVEATSEEL